MTPTPRKCLLAAAFAAMYAAVGLVRHWHFGSNAYDLGIVDQMVWHLSRFETPASTVRGLSNMFGDHFSPIIVLMVPFSWIYPHAESLIVAQALALAGSIVPVWIFLERRLPSTPATLLTLAYACFWGLQRTAQFDVHEFAFAPALIAVMLLGVDRACGSRRGFVAGGLQPSGTSPFAPLPTRNPWPLFAAGAISLCLVKEDLVPLVAAASLLMALRARDPRDRRRALVASALALAVFVMLVRWWIPSLHDARVYDVGSTFSDVIAHPATLFAKLVSPSVKLQTVLMWLLPFAFLPLASAYGWLIVPLALERFLSASPNHWGTSFHYSAPLAPILAMAAGDGLARIGSRIGSSSALRDAGTTGPAYVRVLRQTYVAALCLLLCAVLPGRQPMWKVFSRSFYQAPPFAETARRALALIPADASVVAQSPIVPHLSRRAGIYMLRAEGRRAGTEAQSEGQYAGNDAQYVIAAAADLAAWPLNGADDVRAQLATYRGRGYSTVFDERGWIVLKRGGEGR